MSLQKICSNTPPKARYPFPAPHRGYGSITGIGDDTQVAPDRIKSPSSIKRATPGAFKTAEFFMHGKNTFQLSYLEISKAQGIQELTAKLRIKSDIENGYITKERTTYKSPKYKVLLDGRNIYHLTEKGRQKTTPLPNIPQRYSHSSNEECFAKSKAPESAFQSQFSNQQLLQRHGLTKLVGIAPSWWFKDLEFLEKTLKLLNQKQAKGYKTQNPLRWISAVLKQEGVGYREKITKETAQKLRGELPAQTPFEKDVLKALQSLLSKGLDISHSSLCLFLSKGLMHLQSSLTVIEKYIEWNKPIKSLTGMLFWIVKQKNPLELLKPLKNSPEKQISKLRAFFTHNSSHFIFNKPTSESSMEKPHIEFFIHKKAPLSSVIKIYKKIGGEWRCMTLEMGKVGGNFYEVVMQKIVEHCKGYFNEDFALPRCYSTPTLKTPNN